MWKSIKLFSLGLTVSISPLVTCAAFADDFEILNFRSGLTCPFHPEMDGGWVCFETETIEITGRSDCNYGGDLIPCTWYGFEFSYKNAPEGARLECRSVQNRAGSFGNPTGELSGNTRTFEYTIDIEAGDGRFYNPQYSGIYPQSMTGKVTQKETSCSYRGKDVLTSRMELIYPDAYK